MKIAAISGCVALLVGLALRFFTHADVVGATMVVLLVILPLLGWFATIDDADDFLLWRCWESWAEITVRASYSGIGFAIDVGWRSPTAILPWLVGIVGIVATLFLHRRMNRLKKYK